VEKIQHLPEMKTPEQNVFLQEWFLSAKYYLEIVRNDNWNRDVILFPFRIIAKIPCPKKED
jgi:hypothetical protein